MTFTYTRDIPDTPNNPSNDQPPMKVNTNSIDDLLAVDHGGFNNANSGYHTVVHQIPVTGTWNPNPRTPFPAPVAGIGEIYSMNYTPDYTGAPTDTQFFAQTGAGGISQLTGSASQTEGWQWIGGVLLQWGSSAAAGTTVTAGSFASGTAVGTTTFKDRAAGAIPFPRATFVAFGVPFSTGSLPSSQASVTINTATITNNGFTWGMRSGSAQITGFYWWAIGW